MVVRRAARGRVSGQCSGLRLSACTTAVVVGTTERHGRGRSTLRGNCQHKQPDEQRSDQQPHNRTLPQWVRPRADNDLSGPAPQVLAIGIAQLRGVDNGNGTGGKERQRRSELRPNSGGFARGHSGTVLGSRQRSQTAAGRTGMPAPGNAASSASVTCCHALAGCRAMKFFDPPLLRSAGAPCARPGFCMAFDVPAVLILRCVLLACRGCGSTCRAALDFRNHSSGTAVDRAQGCCESIAASNDRCQATLSNDS